jgi:hypothetical protein
MKVKRERRKNEKYTSKLKTNPRNKETKIRIEKTTAKNRRLSISFLF